MGARRRLGKAAACAVLLLASARSGASTVVEPIARLSLEGGYDTNVFYDGRSEDRMARVSPEAGLRLRDHLWDVSALYGADWITYERIDPGGSWNHRGALTLDARPTRRLQMAGLLRGSWAFDPVGLAQAGVFRSGRQSALLVMGRGRAEYRWSRRVDAAVTYSERTVLFEDDSGGARHAPGVEALWRLTRRLSLGAGYGLGVFQEFEPDGNELAFSHALKARARWRASRRLTVEASAGPAVWMPPAGPESDTAVVPEASIEALGVSRDWALRAEASHGLGIGSTARPALVDAFEVAAERRMGRYVLRGEGGIWHSGVAPTGRDAVTGYAVAGEAGVLVGMNVRLAIGVTHFARLDEARPELRRTTMGLRLGWELAPAR